MQVRLGAPGEQGTRELANAREHLFFSIFSDDTGTPYGELSLGLHTKNTFTQKQNNHYFLVSRISPALRYRRNTQLYTM